MTAGVAIATLIVSGLVIVTGMVGYGAVAAGFIPARFDGVALPAGIVGVPVWLTPVTATLLHGGWAHLAFNLLMLLFCGSQTERALGGAGVGALYLVGALGAAGGQYLLGPHSVVPTIGASGAIAALLAAYALLYGRRPSRRGGRRAGLLNALWLLAAWIGINVLMGLGGFGGMTIAIGAHIGGFVVGLIATRPLLSWRYRNA